MLFAIFLGLTGCSKSLLAADTAPPEPPEEGPGTEPDDTPGLPTWDDDPQPPPSVDTGDSAQTADTGFMEDTGVEDETWTGQWGEVDTGAGEYWTGFQDLDGATVRCDVEYALVPVGTAQGCGACSSAMTYTLDDLEIYANDAGRCEQLGWTTLEGSTLTVGHAEPDALWQQTGASWNEVGWSTMTGTLWEFEIDL